jgi:toxin CptA
VPAPVKLRIAIGPSHLLAAVLGIAHIAALVVTVVVVLPTWVKSLIAMALVTSGTWSILRLALQRGPSAIVELEVEAGGRISCRTRDGRWREGQVLSSSFVSPWLTVLNLRMAGSIGAKHLVILPDNVEKDAFRRIRVLLKWARPASEGPRLPEETPQ